MRITASVLRGFIRETLLREADPTPGPMPGTPGKVVKNKSVLMQLQEIIGATKTGVYDDQTETAWDTFVDKNFAKAEVFDATIDEVKNDWASAAPKITSIGGAPASFEPNIKGMYNFALQLTNLNDTSDAQQAQVSDNSVPAPKGPWRTDAQPDVWPTGVTLDDANEWDVYLEDDYLFKTNATPVVMYDAYDTIVKALQSNKEVSLIGANGSLGYIDTDQDGYADDDVAGGVFPITIKDISTLDSIFKGTAAEQESKSESEKRFSSEEDET